MTTPRFTVGVLVFPGITQLDATAPCELFSSVPAIDLLLIGNDLEPVTTQWGLAFRPSVTFDDAPELDVVCVPGGVGVNALMENERCLEFLRRTAERASYVTSVCTGALVLGAAGLLRGYRATTHWLNLEFLEAFGAIAVRERVVIDRSRITGGGVTAGIDLGLTVVAELAGRTAAEKAQLYLEYAPRPPFHSGSPETACPELVQSVRDDAGVRQETRRRIVERAAKRAKAFGISS